MEIYADLPEMRASENPQGTIPDNVIITSARPDIVIIEQGYVHLIELTIPHSSPDSMTKAKERKSEKQLYQQALSDMESKGLAAEPHTISIAWLWAIGCPHHEPL